MAINPHIPGLETFCGSIDYGRYKERARLRIHGKLRKIATCTGA
jgi:hypothetical protein